LRDRLKSTAGWLFALAFLVLPNCGLPSGEGDPGDGGCEADGTCGDCESGACDGVTTNLKPGDQPWTGSIFCDIEDMNNPRRCATQADIDNVLNLRRSHAAMDLVFGTAYSNTVLDYSDAAIAAQACPAGTLAVVITYRSPFPVGQQACLNCGGAIGGGYSDVSAACVDLCRDVNGAGSDAFCFAPDHAQAATNDDRCYEDACTNEDDPISGWPDPRRTPEAVVWQDLLPAGTVSTGGAEGNDLKRDAATSPTPAFDAGADSVQTITKGDGYVEFTATEIDTARVCGLSVGTTDGGETDLDIGFGIRLSGGGHVLIAENGVLVVPPNGDDINFWFADYVAGDHFRVTVTANPDGTTANIEYFQIPNTCTAPGCPATKLRPSDGDPPITAAYPFRVDASLRDQNATLTDVRIVRVK